MMETMMVKMTMMMMLMKIWTSPSLNISISICNLSSLPTEYSKRFLEKTSLRSGMQMLSSPQSFWICTWSLAVTPEASARPRTGASSIEDGGRLQARAASKAVSLSLILGNRYTSSDWQNGTSLESITLCLQTLSSSLARKNMREVSCLRVSNSTRASTSSVSATPVPEYLRQRESWVQVTWSPFSVTQSAELRSIFPGTGVTNRSSVSKFTTGRALRRTVSWDPAAPTTRSPYSLLSRSTPPERENPKLRMWFLTEEPRITWSGSSLIP